MKVDDVLLSKLEKLSMIKIADSKKESFKNELSMIIEKMDSLQEVNTNAITLHDSHKTPMREDIPHDSQIRDKILANAPNSQDGYFVVPKILG